MMLPTYLKAGFEKGQATLSHFKRKSAFKSLFLNRFPEHSGERYSILELTNIICNSLRLSLRAFLYKTYGVQPNYKKTS